MEMRRLMAGWLLLGAGAAIFCCNCRRTAEPHANTEPRPPRPKASSDPSRAPWNPSMAQAHQAEALQRMDRLNVPVPELLLLDSTGEIDEEVLEKLGEKSHGAEIAAAVGTARAAMSRLIAEAAKEKTRHVDPQKIIYWIPAQEAAGAAILQKLKADLAGISGPEQAEKLMTAFHAAGQFGAFGQWKIHLRFPRFADGEAGEEFITYGYFDPESGNCALGRVVTKGELRRDFGDAFDGDGRVMR